MVGINNFEEKDHLQKKGRIIEWYMEHYNLTNLQDIYRWLWEGEYGSGNRDFSLDKLIDDIHLARINSIKKDRIWEPAGLALTLIKINLVPYVNFGCPLKRLLSLEERVLNIHPNPLRFKEDWALIKTKYSKSKKLSTEDFNDYENSIPFHTVPIVQFSAEYINKFGLSYRILPRNLFFEYFPEYEIEEETFFRLITIDSLKEK